MNYHISETIKEIRRIHNLTQEALAQIVDKSAGHVGMMEQGRSNPSYATMEILIAKFNLDANMFFESKREDKDIITAEISKILEGMTASQAHGLVQILRVAAQIVIENDKLENSNM